MKKLIVIILLCLILTSCRTWQFSPDDLFDLVRGCNYLIENQVIVRN